MIDNDAVLKETFAWLDRVTTGEWRYGIGTESFGEILNGVEKYIYAEGAAGGAQAAELEEELF